MPSSLVVYLPVLHQGYLELFGRHPTVRRICLVGERVLDDLGYEVKEIRALRSDIGLRVVMALGVSTEVVVLTPELAASLDGQPLVIASDEVTRATADRYWPTSEITWDTAFLRWDKSLVFSQQPVHTDGVVDASEFIRKAAELTEKSSDWWRQVGAVVVKDGKIILEGYNRHDPSEHTPYIIGDPRDFIQAGEHSELCGATHCEALITAIAARQLMRGADLFVTTFPCPACARLLAHVGIGTLYFQSGHASLDGESVLRSHGVKIIQVR